MTPHRLITLILLAVAVPVAAAAVEIRGSLTDSLTAMPIAGAEIRASAEGLDLRTRTGEAGEFVLEIPETLPESLRVRVTAAGFQSLDLVLTEIDPARHLALRTRAHFASEVEVTGMRAEAGQTPVTVTNVSREEIEEQDWAQDVPVFLSTVPGFYAYNDSGNGIGYSYFFLRGFDMRRTAVSLNGVPLNDAHSHGLFFIDLADFLSTTDTIQVQRGVGTNLYGGSAIGGSIDLQTGMPAAPCPRTSRRPSMVR